ncbi:MAG TPA: helix-turn-helix domain-containing protein [Bacillales bacterium]|nr:helix-turn-helix domain-containing protein [Bacillales bacterium]
MNSIDTFDNNGDNKNRKDGENDMEAAELTERMKQSDWMTTGQAKKMLGVSSVNTVKRWVADGKLEGQKVGRNNWMRISAESVQRLLKSGDANVRAFQSLKNRFDDMSDSDFEVTKEDLSQMSDRQMSTLPWEKSEDK